MNIFSAGFKTLLQKINQSQYNRDMKHAQVTAYNGACKDAKGKFDPNWQSNYKRRLYKNQQKAKDKKELRSTFIGGL